PKILDLKERALFPIHNQGAMYRVMEYSMTLFSTILTMIGLIAMISMLNPLMILFLFLMAILSAFINKKAQQVMFKFYQLLIPVNRKFSYFGNLTSDFSYGKEIRLYKMDDLIMDRIEDYNHTTLTVFTDLYEVLGRYAAYSEVMMQIQIVFVYLYMVYKVVVKSIGLGDFTMYASAATQFGQCLSQILNTYMELSQMCRYMESYIEFDALKPSVLSGKETDVPMDNLTLEFKNVSFKYPKSEVNVLNNVNVTILPGEKLSIVGLNGAGKTTFIKLLTRLYEPTEGAIYLNGVNILEYDLKEYLALMSVVFQDFKLFAFSVKDNIVFNQVEKDETIIEVLREAGFEKDLANLPKGIETPIYKTFEEDGVEFSGGQSQKIAISRAIYKNSPIVILDEPTSALDPMTEYDIYHRFNELVGAKT
ncbi:ATP-binding cassette domain-containing protein, partial [Turicibacter sanguinis]|nr:ATP-binding cassette domain-containing protein [Turicibacter sanguinis]